MKTSRKPAPRPCPPATKPFRSGDLLTSSGLRSLLDGFRARQRQHLATVHGIWGVVAGLAARTETMEAEGRPGVVIDPGVALDASGRLRILAQSASPGAPPAGNGPWRIVLAFPVEDGPPVAKWAAIRSDPESDTPVRTIELARWRPGGTLDLSYRPVAWRPGARNSARLTSGTAGAGNLPIIVNGTSWSVRVDTSSALFSGGVAYLVQPVPPKAGTSWSVIASWDDAFVFEAVNWPLPKPDPNTIAKPTLPVALSWIGVETGNAGLTSLTASSARSSTMTLMDSPTDDPVRGPEPASTAPFAVPPRPVFVANTLLTAGELTQSLAFLNAMQDLHNQYLHDWGIAAGLGVSIGTGTDGSPIQIGPGLAVDSNGREILLDTSYQINAPIEVQNQSPGPFLLVLHAPTDPANTRGVPAWRDPMARSGPRVLQSGTDVVLASVTFKAGKFSSLDATVRRPVRPTAAPSVMAGSTVPGATVWAPYFAGQQTKKSTPSGIVTHVPANVANLIVLAQLAGSRVDATTDLVYDGPSFVANQDAGGFDFVVLFPDGLSSWRLSSFDDLKRLIDKLKAVPMQWSVSWIAVSKSP